MRRLTPIAAIAALALSAPAVAANLTPDQLTQATTINNSNLLLLYPSGGPMQSVQWSVMKSLMQTALGTAYLQVTNNLSDLASPSTARTNLGLGTASLINTGTSGGTIGLLNSVNSYSAEQFFQAGSTASASINIAAGVAPTIPLNGDLWATTTAPFMRLNGVTQQLGFALGFTPVNKAGDTMTGALTNSAGFIGNTSTATALQTGRTIAVSGDATGTSAAFNGSANATVPVTLASVVAPGTCALCSVQFDAKGRAINYLTGTATVTATVAEFVEQEVAGNSSAIGSITATIWTPMVFNATVGNNIAGASLNTSTFQFTLPAGTYQIHGYAVARAGTGAMGVARLRNITSGATFQGQAVTFGPATLNTLLPFQATFTIGSPCVFDVDVWTATLASGGFDINTGANEVYSDVQIEKVG